MDHTIETELQNILASRRFCNAPRLSKFLRFLVEQKAAGNMDALKESVIAHEVYDRGTNYDSARASTVRTEAVRLRKALSEYYEGLEKPAAIRFEIPVGSYVPVFHYRPSESPVIPVSVAASALNDAAPLLPGALSVPASQLLGTTSPERSPFRFSAQKPLWLFGVSSIVALILGFYGYGKRFDNVGKSPQSDTVKLLLQASDALHTAAFRNVPAEGISVELKDAIRLFGVAIKSDPDYAAAWAGLSRAKYRAARSDRANFLRWMNESRRAARKATDLEAGQADGWTVQARIAYYVDFDLQRAEKLYERGVPLDQSDEESAEEYVDLLMQLGKSAKAQQIVGQQLGRAPHSSHWRLQQAKLLLADGRSEEAIQLVTSSSSEQVAPASVYWLKGKNALLRGDRVAAQEFFEQSLLDEPLQRASLTLAGEMAAFSGNRDRQQQINEALEQRIRLGRSAELSLARIAAAANDQRTSIKWLTEAFRYRDPAVVFVTKNDPAERKWFQTISHLPEYKRLLQEFPAWRALWDQP
jgi:hypothetical protein